MSDAFDDVLKANAEYARRFALGGLVPKAGKGLAVVTCMDSRIEPLAMLGPQPGDAKILRNCGCPGFRRRAAHPRSRRSPARGHRVLVVPHTGCRMAQSSDDDIHELIASSAGIDTRSLEFRTTPDQIASLTEDLTRIKAHPMLPGDLAVAGAMYDVETGVLTRVA